MAVTMSTSIVNLEIISWAFSLGGKHFTGQIKGFRSEKDFHSVEVKHRLTAKEAKALNKKDSACGYSLQKPGDWSNRFETLDGLRRAAISLYKREFPKAIVLLEGNGGIADAQPCLDGPTRFREAVNKIVAAKKQCGGYERNPKTMEALYLRYRKLVKNLP